MCIYIYSYIHTYMYVCIHVYIHTYPYRIMIVLPHSRYLHTYLYRIMIVLPHSRYRHGTWAKKAICDTNISSDAVAAPGSLSEPGEDPKSRSTLWSYKHEHRYIYIDNKMVYI